jgi:hypothetical protein
VVHGGRLGATSDCVFASTTNREKQNNRRDESQRGDEADTKC